jgi:hypothetical protein
MLFMPSPRRIAPRLRAALSSALTATALLGLAQSSHAQLARVGPISPVNGYPMWYEDANGLKLGLCQDAARCFFVLPNPLAPAKFPAFDGDPTANWPDEAFYYALNGTLTGVNGARGVYTAALEAAFAGGGVKVGDQIVFARIRLRLTGLVDGATYTVTHPYGTETLIAGDGALPGEINITRDVGIGAPGVFTGALAGDIGPFVTPVGFLGGPQGTFLSDGVTEVAIQGSANLVGGVPANFVRVDGPNVGLAFPANSVTLDRVQLNTFVIQGQIAPQFGVSADKFHYLRTPTQTSVNVWASTASGQALRVSIDGGPAIPMVENGATGRYFVRGELGAGALRPTSLAVINISDSPPTQAIKNLTDLVTPVAATFTLGGQLNVQASSSDAVLAPTLTARLDNGTNVALIPQGQGVSVGTFGIPLGTIAPHTVTVTSAQGGSVEMPVKVVGFGTFAGAATLIANAGLDQTVAAGAAVSLSGSAIGGATTFAWTHDAGAQITLIGANTATPSFTAPNVAAPLNITFTLTVTNAPGALSATDTVVVRVNPPLGADVLAIQVARFLVNKRTWRVSGTSSILQAHTVSVYLGAVGNTARKIGEATVDALGTWRINLADNAAVASNTVPGVGDVTIWARSSLAGADVASGFELR